jgi:transcriptional regulator with XRE-family HTH domain
MNNIRDKELLILLGNHIRKIRVEKKMTMEELSYECDMELSQIYRIEKGKVNATVSSLYAIAKGFKISLQELIQDLDISSIS